jgi:hypothetical protein
MDLTTLKSSDLQKISKLLERKENLQAEIGEIDRQLEDFQTGEAPPAPRARKAAPAAPRAARPGAARRSKKAGRGQMKEKIAEALKGAGKEGLSVKELAERLRTNYGNVSVWFQTTGKKVGEIKKVGPARYAWVG